MRKFLLLCVCMMLLPLVVFAQDKGEASFGYSYLAAGKSGWNANGGINLEKHVVVVGDLGGYYSHNQDIHSFMAGVKLQYPYRRHGFNPWGRFLFGVSHDSEFSGATDTARSWALGGGIDPRIYHNFGLRLSLEAFHTHFFNNGTMHVRLGAGVVYHF